MDNKLTMLKYVEYCTDKREEAYREYAKYNGFTSQVSETMRENNLDYWKNKSIRFYYWKNGGCYIMKLCKANYEETKNVMIESIKKFIDYINEYCSEYAWLNDNMEKYTEESKGRVEEFIAEHNIDMEEWMKQKKYYDYKYISTDILNHIDDIHQKIIEVFIEPEMKYPAKVLEWMYNFRFFCYNDDTKGEFLSLSDQNERLKKYPHFDVSMKKPKCLGDFK